MAAGRNRTNRDRRRSASGEWEAVTEIRSRTTLEHVIRKGILTMMVAGFAIAFAYDGLYGYPHKNLKEALRNLDPKPESEPPINPAVTSKSVAWIKKGTLLKDVVARFGEPGWRTPGGSKVYYFGPAYTLTLTTSANLVLDVEGREAKDKTAYDLMVQKVLAVILTVIAVPLIIHYVRVLTYKARLTEAGLKLTGKPFVPLDAMKSLDSSDYQRKGWVDIAYALDGVDGTLRLDDYKIRQFRPILAAICQRKGFELPLDKKSHGQPQPEASAAAASGQASDDPPPTS
jgi:hypothetical protein